MTIAIWALATYSIVATATHLGSILIATSKCRKPIGGWLGRGFVWRGNEMRPLESRGAV
jgi:hypothetical protein